MESREDDVPPLAASAMADAAENADAGVAREAAMRKAKVFMFGRGGEVKLCQLIGIILWMVINNKSETILFRDVVIVAMP